MDEMTQTGVAKVAKWLLTEAVKEAYDESIGSPGVSIDPITGNIIGKKVPLGTIPETYEWTFTGFDPPPGQNIKKTAVLKDQATGDPLLVLGTLDAGTIVDPGQQAAFNDTVNQLVNDDVGKVALDDLPEATKVAVDTEAKEAEYAAAEPANKLAADKVQNETQSFATDETKKAAKKSAGKHDAARVSREHHEWKYCCIDSNNYSLLLGVDSFGPLSLKYTGPQAMSTKTGVDPAASDAPPYFIWIKWPEFRDVMKVVRRFRRLRGGCGGKALWTEQGFATKLAAIQDDIKGDADYIAAHAILIADTDWAIA